MSANRIRYVKKTATHHEHITHVGNDAGWWTVEQVVAWIDDKEHTFYVEEAGKRANVGVNQRAGKKYLQTYADGVWQNNLLSLPASKVAAA